MKLLRNFILLVAVLGCALSPGLAQDNMEGRNDVSSRVRAEQQLDRAEKLQLAYSLVVYGRKARSAEALILAAQLFGTTPTSDLGVGKTSESDGRTARGEKDTPAPPIDPKELLEMAELYAPASLEERIEEVRAGIGASQKGPSGGTKSARHRVDANSTDTFEVSMRGDEAWTVTVDGDGDTDLDLYVYDEDGNLLDSDTDGTDYCVCRGNTRWSGPFTIKVKNLGDVYNDYQITVE